MQTVAVCIIVALAAGFVGRRIWLAWKSQGTRGCGCSGCDGCGVIIPLCTAARR